MTIEKYFVTVIRAWAWLRQSHDSLTSPNSLSPNLLVSPIHPATSLPPFPIKQSDASSTADRMSRCTSAATQNESQLVLLAHADQNKSGRESRDRKQTESRTQKKKKRAQRQRESRQKYPTKSETDPLFKRPDLFAELPPVISPFYVSPPPSLSLSGTSGHSPDSPSSTSARAPVLLRARVCPAYPTFAQRPRSAAPRTGCR